MVSLATSLNAGVGISAAKGIDLLVQRDVVQAAGTSATTAAATGTSQGSRSGAAQTLTPEQQRQVDTLKQTDQRVRQHEQAHLTAGRSIVIAGPSYTYTYGPDGKAYATGGEVSIDTSPARKPQENIDKGQLIQRAALAPRDPSPQDYRVAASGGRLEATGRLDLAAQQRQAQAVGQAAVPQETPSGAGNGAAARATRAYAGAANIGAAAASVVNLFA